MEGSYEILGVVGRSGLGTLYSARFVGEGGFSKLVALKMLDEGVTESDEVACRLRDEARVLGFLKHPTIVQADRLIRLAGRWTLVQEHVDGVDLESILTRGPMPDGPALEVAAGVAGALHAAYTSPGPDGASLRLQHRDIKPATILVDAYGAPHVIDFGIARAFFSGRESHTRSFVVGSFEYMAPERLALEEGGPWSDIYSLGQVLFALLLGHGFGRSHPSERHHKVILDRVMEQLSARPGGVDEELRDLLGRMLALEPHERPDARSVERSCAGIARRLGQETLRSWAEQVVEPMLHARTAASRGGLVGRRLSEGEAAVPRPAGPPLADPGMVGPQSAAGPTTPARPLTVTRPGLQPVPAAPASGEDDATEIMSLSPAGGRLERGPPSRAETETETTEAIDDPGGMSPVRPVAASPAPAMVDPEREVAPGASEPGGGGGANYFGPMASVADDDPGRGLEPDPLSDHPTTIEPWDSSDLEAAFAAGVADEVTAVTDFSLEAGSMDHEGPTIQRHPSEAAEPTGALGDEHPPGQAARFDPDRVLPVDVVQEGDGERRDDEPEIYPGSTVPLMDGPFTWIPEASPEPTAVPEPPPPPPPPPPPVVETTAREAVPPAFGPPTAEPELPVYGRPKHWTPPHRQVESTRPQPDEWVPPSAETLSGRHPRPTLPIEPSEQDETFIPPAPLPAPPLDDTLASRPEPEPTLERVTPLPPMPDGAVTEVVDEPTPSEPVLADSPAPGVAPPPRPSPPPARKKRHPYLLIALALLLIAGLLLAVMAAAATVAWFVLGA